MPILKIFSKLSNLKICIRVNRCRKRDTKLPSTYNHNSIVFNAFNPRERYENNQEKDK